MTSSTAVLADSNRGPGKKSKSVSFEIESMPSKSNLVIEDDLTVRVLFTLSEDNKIQIKSIKSENEEVVAFINERLDQKKVYGKNWTQDMLYELPVRVQGK